VPANPNPISSNRIQTEPRFLRHPAQQTIVAKASPGTILNGRLERAALLAAVAIVSVVAAALPVGVTVAGANVHVAPAGNPVQLNVTAALNPFAGVTEMLAVALCPAVTVSAAGEAATAKSGGATLITYCAEAIALFAYPGAMAIA
jgi:hypothetical protein